MASAANAISRAEAPTATPRRPWTRSSSVNVTHNLPRSVSARVHAAMTTSTSQATVTSTVITASAAHQCRTMLPVPASGRKTKAVQATASSRDAMPAVRAGRPTARCGSTPSAMPTAVTATTWNAECRAGDDPTRISRAYASAQAVPIGAASRSPGRLSRSSSPSAIRAAKAIALRAATTPVATDCAIQPTASRPDAATSSRWP